MKEVELRPGSNDVLERVILRAHFFLKKFSYNEYPNRLRNYRIMLMRLKGYSYSDISRRSKVTRTRANQIVLRTIKKINRELYRVERCPIDLRRDYNIIPRVKAAKAPKRKKRSSSPRHPPAPEYIEGVSIVCKYVGNHLSKEIKYSHHVKKFISIHWEKVNCSECLASREKYEKRENSPANRQRSSVTPDDIS